MAPAAGGIVDDGLDAGKFGFAGGVSDAGRGAEGVGAGGCVRMVGVCGGPMVEDTTGGVAAVVTGAGFGV